MKSLGRAYPPWGSVTNALLGRSIPFQTPPKSAACQEGNTVRMRFISARSAPRRGLRRAYFPWDAVIDAFLGEGKPSPRPPPKSAARQEGNIVRMRFTSARSALGRGSGGGLALLQKSIGLKKSPSVSNALISYDRTHTAGWHRGATDGCTIWGGTAARRQVGGAAAGTADARSGGERGGMRRAHAGAAAPRHGAGPVIMGRTSPSQTPPKSAAGTNEVHFA